MELSPLAKTWLIDVDGTIVKHNGYLIDGEDTILDGVKDFFDNLPNEDKIILLTARKGEFLNDLKTFLQKTGLRYDHILSDIPMGERILINDIKPSGLKTAYAINKERDADFMIKYNINPNI